MINNMKSFFTVALPWILTVLGVLLFACGCMGSDKMQYAGALFIIAGIVVFDTRIQEKKKRKLLNDNR